MRSHFAIYFLMILFIAATFTTSFAQLPWTKDANNPVLSGGASGTWNRHAMMPCVLFNADSARFEMWYAGSYGSPNWRPYQIGFAVSDDGINWNRLDTPVLTATPGTWDESTVEWPRVIRENGLYKMWYTGWSEDSLGIGYATSTNGVNWIKDTLNNPVLSGPSDWATGGCWYCSVFPVAEGYEMWYTGSDYEYSEANIGRATSIDGINWQKDTLNNPVLTAGDAGRWDSENVYVPSVNYIEGKYYMWYNSKKTNPRIRQVGFAHSIDGINWTKYNNPATESTLYIDSDPVLVPTAGQWDGTYVEHGSVLLIENTLHMWYSGSLYPDGTNLWRIGHATAPVVKNVPGDFATIQAAIDAAHDGNVVLVDEGTYYENINFKGKAITVASYFYVDGDESHVDKTIIDGSKPSNPDSGSVVFFVSGEDTTSVLIGFTIKGGTGTKSKIEDLELRAAGGVFLDFSGGKVIHNKIINNTINQNDMYCYSGGIEVFTKSGVTCIIRENEIAYNSVYADWGGGGGVGLGGGDHVVFERNYVHHNLYSSLRHGHGGGVVILGGASGYMGQMELLHNVITDNTILSQANYKYGGGIYSETPNLLMVGNIIAKNKAYYGGGFCTLTLSSFDTRSKTIMINNTITDNTGKAAGAVWNRESDLVIINSILWGNYGDKQVSGMSAYSLDIAFSNVQDGWNGGSNISIDPKLIHVERTPGDTVFYCLDEASPCIDTGPDTSFFFDNENKFRPGSTLWPAMNSLRNDMGAYGGKRTYDIEDLPIVVDWVLDIPGNATQLPLSYKLNQNYPNPFNPVTAIGYQLSAISDVELSIYNVLGQKIVTLVSERQSAGPHQVEWDASMMASGIYYYKIEAGEFLQVRKMILIR